MQKVDTMTYSEIKQDYGRLMVLGAEGKPVLLREFFPIVIPVDKQDSWAFLDTGGRMSECSFFVIKVEGGQMWATQVTEPKPEWYVFSKEVYLKEEGDG